MRALPREAVCAEIGVWKGDGAAEILRRLHPRKLHLVDPWRFEPTYEQARYGGRSSQEELDAICASVEERFAGEIEAGIVEIHRLPSEAAAARFVDCYFDWVFIDGNHLYEFVKRDLEAFGPKVRPGGFVAGDDYADEGWWEGGVRRAVDEAVAEGSFTPVMLAAQFLLVR
jgi:methyltransferase family protein